MGEIIWLLAQYKIIEQDSPILLCTGCKESNSSVNNPSFGQGSQVASGTPAQRLSEEILLRIKSRIFSFEYPKVGLLVKQSGVG